MRYTHDRSLDIRQNGVVGVELWQCWLLMAADWARMHHLSHMNVVRDSHHIGADLTISFSCNSTCLRQEREMHCLPNFLGDMLTSWVVSSWAIVSWCSCSLKMLGTTLGPLKSRLHRKGFAIRTGPQFLLRAIFKIANPFVGEMTPMPERSMRASAVALCAAIPTEDQAPHCKLQPTRIRHFRHLGCKRCSHMPSIRDATNIGNNPNIHVVVYNDVKRIARHLFMRAQALQLATRRPQAYVFMVYLTCRNFDAACKCYQAHYLLLHS